jgi:hypothetical protein
MEARTVPYAIGSVNNGSFAVYNAQNVLFGAGGHASRTANAHIQVNIGVQRYGLVQSFLLGYRYFLYGLASGFVFLPKIEIYHYRA